MSSSIAIYSQMATSEATQTTCINFLFGQVFYIRIVLFFNCFFCNGFRGNKLNVVLEMYANQGKIDKKWHILQIKIMFFLENRCSESNLTRACLSCITPARFNIKPSFLLIQSRRRQGIKVGLTPKYKLQFWTGIIIIGFKTSALARLNSSRNCMSIF